LTSIVDAKSDFLTTDNTVGFTMGADGGSIPDRRDLVRTKGKAEITDRALLRELFFFCALSKVSTKWAGGDDPGD
jgi:hypothetical protein